MTAHAVAELAASLSTAKYRLATDGATVTAYDTQAASILAQGKEEAALAAVFATSVARGESSVSIGYGDGVFPRGAGGVPQVPPNINLGIQWSPGTRIVGSPTAWQYMAPGKVADHDKFNVYLDGRQGTYDFNNIPGVSGHMLFGTWTGAGQFMTRVSSDWLVLKNWRIINAIDQDDFSTDLSPVYFVPAHTGVGDGSDFITYANISHWRCEGGNIGVVVGGSAPTALQCNVTVGKCVVKDWVMLRKTVPAANISSSSVQIGSYALVEEAIVCDGHGENAADVFVEVDNGQTVVIVNCVDRDSCNGITLTNFKPPRDVNSQTWKVRTKKEVVNLTPSTATPGDGIFIGAHNPIGHVDIRIDFESSKPGVVGLRPINTSAAQMKSLKLRGSARYPSIAYTGVTVTRNDWLLQLVGPTLLDMDVTTVIAGSTVNPITYRNIFLTCTNGLRGRLKRKLDFNLTGQGNGNSRGLLFGATTTVADSLELEGECINFAGDTAPEWSHVSGTGTLTINEQVRSRDKFYNGYPAGGTKYNVDATNAAKHFVDGVPELKAITYAAAMTPDALAGRRQTIVATNGTAFTIAAPKNPVYGMDLLLDIKNASGGVMGAVTWNAVFLLDATGFVAPANGKRKTIRFYFDGTNWVQAGPASADI